MDRLRSTEIAAALSAAMAERRLVRLTTRFEETVVRGYVTAMGPGFVLVAVVNDRIWFDGFECFRRPDVMDVADDEFAEFVETALARRGEGLPDPPPVSLASIEELLVSAGRVFRLVTIQCEQADPDVCWIGHVRKVQDGELLLLQVGPDARWDDGPERHRMSDITRVSFGADYEEALSLVAGDPPG
jgi:hypothetical protein